MTIGNRRLTLVVRSGNPSAFGRGFIPRCCVAPPSNTPGILGRRALQRGRILALGATRDFPIGPLSSFPRQVSALHRGGDFGVLHEPAPDSSGTEIFGAEEGDAQVDADHIRVHPAVSWMKRIGKPIAPIDPLAKAAAQFAHHRHRDVRREHQRARGRTRDDAAVDCLMTGRTAPRNVALATVRSGDPPDVLRIARELARECSRRLCAPGSPSPSSATSRCAVTPLASAGNPPMRERTGARKRRRVH